MQPSILDTSILTKLFRSEPSVIKKANQHVALYGRLYITIITYYEVMRGIKYKAAKEPYARRQAL